MLNSRGKDKNRFNFQETNFRFFGVFPFHNIVVCLFIPVYIKLSFLIRDIYNNSDNNSWQI